jgi:DNA-binding NtrC family response regulator
VRHAILVVEDRRSLGEMLCETLRKEKLEAELVLRGDTAIERISSGAPLLAVLSDLKLPGANGLAVLRAARRADPALPVFLITAYASVETAVEALKEGARDYFTKPLDIDAVLQALRAAVGPRQALLESPPAAAGDTQLVGSAPAFAAALAVLRQVAPTDAAVLLLGPSGSGKELFARALHELSRRARGPFVAFNCAAVPDTLVESELFGHERGAFTGATARHVGRFEQAHRGTLFLDEIGEVPLATQAKLLRAVEERRISRLGSEGETEVDVRIVAATNRDLDASVRAGSFRRDLFHRLSVFPVALPALVERRDDIPALALHLLERAATRHGVASPTLRPAAQAALVLPSWPGNVRELANLLERVTILAAGRAVGVAELGLAPEACRTGLADAEARALAVRLAGAEVALLAEFLGVTAKTLDKP